jgi:hypothetical protein
MSVAEFMFLGIGVGVLLLLARISDTLINISKGVAFIASKTPKTPN